MAFHINAIPAWLLLRESSCQSKSVKEFGRPWSQFIFDAQVALPQTCNRSLGGSDILHLARRRPDFMAKIFGDEWVNKFRMEMRLGIEEAVPLCNRQDDLFPPPKPSVNEVRVPSHVPWQFDLGTGNGWSRHHGKMSFGGFGQKP